MRLIVNFNRNAFESFGFDRFNRAEMDSAAAENIMMLLSDGDDGMAFSPANDSANATEGDRERYKIRVPSELADTIGLVGSSRYLVEDDMENPGFFNLVPHSLIIGSQGERFQDPIASVHFTEVTKETEEEREAVIANAVSNVLNGGDPVVIMNTLRVNIMDRYDKIKCWLKGYSDPSVCHIRPYSTGEDYGAQRDLMLDMDNVMLMSPDSQTMFSNGDFTINDDGSLLFADGINPVEDAGFNQKVIDLGGKPKIQKIYRDFNAGMLENIKWHRENVFRG